MIHLVAATHSNSWFYRFAKRDRKLFHKYHIDRYGHIDLELASVLIDHCRKVGFRIVKVEKIYALILPTGIVLVCFDNEYRTESALIGVMVFLSKALCRYKRVETLSDLLLGVLGKLVNPLTPIIHATALLLCCDR